jgi:uncharacterized protein YqiB (DUF1249 family)
MQTLEQKAYHLILQLVPHVLKLEVGLGQASTAAGFMDLHLDCLSSQSESRTISLAHYYRQNGDQVPDPDMEITLYPQQERAVPTSLQNIFGYTYISVSENAQSKKRQALTEFLVQWLENCLAQGHKFNLPEEN